MGKRDGGRASSMMADSDEDLEVFVYKSRQGNHRPETRGQRSDRGGSQHTSVKDETYSDDDDDDDDEPDLDGVNGKPKKRATMVDSPSDGWSSNGDEETEAQEQARHPFYNYATEKYDSHADAKLIYQRHRLDTRTEHDLQHPFGSIGKSHTMPANIDGAQLGRSLSVKSGQSSSVPQHTKQQSKKEPFPNLTIDVGPQESRTRLDHFLAADADARSHERHPNLPHEMKDPLLAHEGVHGAGAGVGLGTGPGGLASSDETIISEVQSICDSIKTVLDLRQQYMKVSLQCPGDNPKDDEIWEVYPPAPEPVWHESKVHQQTKEAQVANSASSSMYISDPKGSSADLKKMSSSTTFFGAPTSPSSQKKFRKPGKAIGADFYFDECDIPGREEKSLSFQLDQGSIYQVYDENSQPIVQVPTLRDYYKALDTVLDIASDGPAKSFAYRRLQYLEGRYNLYTLLNEYEEVAESKKVPHRDFYNVRKVDTHVHHSACMNQKHLLRYIKSKMKKCPNEVVIERDGKQLTLGEVFESINLTAYDLSIDTLDMHAHTDSFHRFDKFNLKYNPIGQSRLRDIFLKTDNFVKGRYLAEITREVISDLESSKYQMVEWRISIYGRNIDEWDKLAGWIVDNKLFSHNVRWLIQIPRLFALYKAMKQMDNFEELIRNIFQPLFEVTQDPSTHPKLHVFLQRVIGFDSVDDESKVERRFYRKFPIPKEWDTKQNPPYGYWIYYLFANMTSLNHWRKRRGLNTFLLRPHCGEAGDTDHLAAALLTCHSISHGITLRKVPLLQYVFYLDQIGVAMSPLSNNALFLTYDRNPFISYFKKGLNVSLSTDDPLQFAFTKEPLIEEYSVAAQIYKLSNVDMCELAKHSVDQCGFELQLKQRWLGKFCYLPGVLGNDVAKCNVPDVREAFRHETLRAEHAFISKFTKDYTHLERCTPTLPDARDPSTPIHEVYRGLESPQHYYEKVADSIPPPQLARKPGSRVSLHHESSGQHAHNAANNFGSPLRPRTSSSMLGLQRASTHTFGANPGIVAEDTHISADAPKAFPGVIHQRERRRSLRKSLTSGSDDVGGITSGEDMGGTGLGADHMISSQMLEKKKTNESKGADGG